MTSVSKGVGIPVKLLHEAEGHIVTVNLVRKYLTESNDLNAFRASFDAAHRLSNCLVPPIQLLAMLWRTCLTYWFSHLQAVILFSEVSHEVAYCNIPLPTFNIVQPRLCHQVAHSSKLYIIASSNRQCFHSLKLYSLKPA